MIKVYGGQTVCQSVNMQWMDLVLLTFIPHFLYHIDKRFRWFWMRFEVVLGFEWRARSALSEKSPVVVRAVVGWSEVNRLNIVVELLLGGRRHRSKIF